MPKNRMAHSSEILGVPHTNRAKPDDADGFQCFTRQKRITTNGIKLMPIPKPTATYSVNEFADILIMSPPGMLFSFSSARW